MGADSATAATPRASDDGADTGGTRWEAGRAGLPYGLLAAVLGVAVWLAVDPRTPDLAAQVYRANLFAEVGWTVWDGRWYGGHDIPGYSLVFPPLAALVGGADGRRPRGAGLGDAVRARRADRPWPGGALGRDLVRGWRRSGTCGAGG